LERWLSAVPASEPGDERSFSLSRCVACGTAVTEGDAPGAASYSEGVYAPRPPRARALVRPLQRATVGQPVRMLRRAGLGDGVRVLDVGAGQGRLVDELRRGGFDARGIDPSERSAAMAAAAGRAVDRAGIDEWSDSDLGAAVLWHVLEHLEDPAEALVRVAGWLAPRGLVVVGVPNAASRQAAIAGERWLHLDLPRHRTHFTPAGLEAILRGAGLEPVATAHMVWEHNPFSLWMAWLGKVQTTPNFPFHALKRNAPLRARDVAVTLAGLPLAPIAVAYEGAAAARGRGGTIAVVARRAASSANVPE
jgi:SAM-dependent methyltransferase